MSTSSLIRVHTTLTRALTWAQRRGKVYRNVSDLVETPAGTQRPSHALTVAQVHTVLDTAEGRPTRSALDRWACPRHAPRRADRPALGARGLRHRRHHRLASPSSTAAASSGRATPRPGTPDAGSRHSRHPDALKKHTAHARPPNSSRPGEAWTDTGLVFTTEVGTPIDPANLRRAFRALLKAAASPTSSPPKTAPGPASGTPTRCATPPAATWTPWACRPSGSPLSSATKEPAPPRAVYIHGQEVIDMTSDGFESYGNQFGNQAAEGGS